MDGKTCHACGKKGPAGEGWQFVAMDLRAQVDAVRAQLAEAQKSAAQRFDLRCEVCGRFLGQGRATLAEALAAISEEEEGKVCPKCDRYLDEIGIWAVTPLGRFRVTKFPGEEVAP